MYERGEGDERRTWDLVRKGASGGELWGQQMATSYIWIVDSGYNVPAGATTIGDAVAVDINLRAPLLKPSAVRVREVYVPNVTYNITTNNNAFTIRVNAIDYPTSIPVGYYTAAALVSAVKNALVAVLALTIYLPSLTASVSSYLTTLTVTDTMTSTLTPFAFATPVVVDDDTPSLLFLLGWDEGSSPIVSITGTATSDGPINSDCDRLTMITCDQAIGMNGAIDSLTPKDWQSGILTTFNVDMPKGQVIDFTPRDDATWVTLVRPPVDGVLTFRLSRNYYRYFGPSRIYWTMVLEVR